MLGAEKLGKHGDPRRSCERSAPLRVVGAPLLDPGVEAPQLHAPKSAGHVGRTQVVTGADEQKAGVDLRELRDPLRFVGALAHPTVRAQAAHRVSQRRVIGDDDPAFDGGDVVAEKEAEGSGVPDAADAAPVVTGTVGGAGVFKHDEAVVVAVCGLPEQVHRHHRFGSSGARRSRFRGIQAQRLRVHVDDDRHQAGLHDGKKRGRPSDRGHQHLVAALQAPELNEAVQHQQVRRRARVDHHPLGAPTPRRPFRLKRAYFSAHRDARGQHAVERSEHLVCAKTYDRQRHSRGRVVRRGRKAGHLGAHDALQGFAICSVHQCSGRANLPCAPDSARPEIVQPRSSDAR